MLTRYTKKFIHYLRTNRAVSALEYAILVGVITVAMATAMATFSGEITKALKNMGENLGKTNTPTPGGTT